MTETRANEIFRTKYENGVIKRKNSTSADCRYWVQFEKDSKVYFYSAASYSILLEKLGFIVLSKKEVEAMRNKIAINQEKINTGKTKNAFFGEIVLSEHQKKELAEEIKAIESRIASAIIE